MRKIPVLALIFSTACAGSLPEVKPVKLSDLDAGAIVYVLPRKRVRVELTVTKFEYDNTARCLDKGGELGLTSPQYKGPTLSVSAVKWSTYPVPDLDQVYRVELEGGEIPRKQKLALAWAPGGIASEASFRSEDMSSAYATSFAKLGASVVGSFFGFGGTKATDNACTDLSGSVKTARLYLLNLRGPLDGASTKEVLEMKEAKLKADLFAMESAFTGTKATVGTIVCDVDVSKANAQELLSWTGAGGVTSQGATCVVPPEFQSTQFEPVGTPPNKLKVGHKVSLNILAEAWGWNNAPAGCAAVSKDGKTNHSWSYHYRRPAPATVVVRDVSNNVSRDVSERRQEWIPQLGQVACLPRVSQATVESKIVFDPTTGELKTIELTGDAVDPTSAIEAGGSLLTTGVKAVKGPSELEAAKEQKELLEALVAIEKARAELESLTR
ncbi:hypothetical protein BO221_19500 [Archangium sp. Cb G35]|uniref:hypothetical protein n=1 Tax=Archangium sp. Cb G35 TaxID=1920190 RepID=UPI0009370828|nr:hypothetical protein [Archangium sp. Cb G35]OJT23072.1 hypothetical protein BO221_19500 [Archangium sp. Cb G35]